MDFAEFKRKIHTLCGVNLDGYKEKQLKRRIDSLMQSLAVNGYDRYLQILGEDRQQLNRFLDRITINVSEFFRNPDIFKLLEDQILPGLLREKARLKIWSAACSNGAEPYSLAILLDEQSKGQHHRIEATDLDLKILAAARQGRYDANSVKNVSADRLARFFTFDNNSYYLKEEIRKKVSFSQHDLITQPYGNDYDLILCRNVTIYFTSEIQDRMYRKFWQSLAAGGVLFIGATESILNYREIGFSKFSSWFYQKGTSGSFGSRNQ
ncbi:MAG: protein-glutamate O-methyltransferase CheR [Syntrophomonadaceae bacterium]|nr:protein-glutamate O-methyltransferase CheR [Syntrophomonadaceae bacterium]